MLKNKIYHFFWTRCRYVASFRNEGDTKAIAIDSRDQIVVIIIIMIINDCFIFSEGL